MVKYDKELVNKYHLNEARKRFQQICEYSFIGGKQLTEDGEEDDMNQGGDMPQQQDANQGGGMPQQDMGDDNSQMGDNMQQPQQNMNMPQDNGQGGEMPQEQPQQDMNMDADFGMDDDVSPMQADDEVIDVDDLTQSQEAAEYKIDGVSEKLTTLLNVVTKFTDALEANDQKIEDLKSEFEKRNPTDDERLNIRSQSSGPYNVSPTDYWKTKEGTNYNVIFNNDVDPDKEEKEYEIRKDDIKGLNTKEIENSFDELPSKVSDFVRF